MDGVSQTYGLRSAIHGLSHGLKIAHSQFLHQFANWCRPFESHYPQTP